MEEEEFNPFPINKYIGKEYFCDREEEAQKLHNALTNGRNTVLFSPRRYGKTGLVKHVFGHYKKSKDVATVFVDIYSAQNISDFNNLFVTAVSTALSSKLDKVMETVGTLFRSLRPVFGFDPFTGTPSVTLSTDAATNHERNIEEIFKVLNSQKKRIFIAIDEFQQIETFEVRMDAILRTHIQQSKNLSFIFSGSQKHLLLPMFTDAKRPFYASTDFLNLGKIDRKVYANFIVKQFKRGNREIAKEDAKFILDWCEGHTYYVQVVCNKVFATGEKTVTRQTIVDTMMSIVLEQDAIISSLRAMLPPVQWDLFCAISREGKVHTPTAKDFIHKYRLSSSAAVVGALKALEEKELVYVSGTDEESGKAVYETYNVFFAKWVRHRMLGKPS